MKNKVSSKIKKRSKKMISPGMLMPLFSIFMCLVFLCSASYAWFTATEKSVENVITSSFFALDIVVVDENGNAFSVLADGDGKHTFTFAEAGTYDITLKMTNEATASKGYCELTISSEAEKKQTESISKDATLGVQKLTFTMTVEENTVVVFEPKWGISASQDIFNGSYFNFADEPQNP